MTADEKVLICTFLVTSEYCLETTQQLEGKLKEKVIPELTGQINLGPEQDVYHSVINSCLQMLVGKAVDLLTTISISLYSNKNLLLFLQNYFCDCIYFK